jgi:hypothetical protein
MAHGPAIKIYYKPSKNASGEVLSSLRIFFEIFCQVLNFWEYFYIIYGIFVLFEDFFVFF